MTTKNEGTQAEIGRVTHFVYDGMLMHVIGTQAETEAKMAQVMQVWNDSGNMMFKLPVVGRDGKVNDLTFSIAGSIVIMDDHAYEGPNAMAFPLDQDGPASMSI